MAITNKDFASCFGTHRQRTKRAAAGPRFLHVADFAGPFQSLSLASGALDF